MEYSKSWVKRAHVAGSLLSLWFQAKSYSYLIQDTESSF